MWLFLEKTSKISVERSDNLQELFDKIELFRDVNMIAGGHDPLQDNVYSITKFEKKGLEHVTENYRINSCNYESLKNELKKAEAELEKWEIIN